MLSVVVPAYNEETDLPRCLRALKEQDYPGDFEVIVVDNGSSDRTAEVARAQGARLVSCPTKGVVHARAAGVMAARGDIVVQTDADTRVPRDWLSRIAASFARHPEAVAVAGDIAYVRPPFWALGLILLRHLGNLLSQIIFGRPLFIRACNFAFRRDAFVRSRGYNTDLPSCGDELDVLLSLSRVGHIRRDRSLIVQTSGRRFELGFWRYMRDYVMVLLAYAAYYWLRQRRPTAPAPQRHPGGGLGRRRWWPLTWRVGFSAVIVAFLAYGFFVPTAPVFGKTYVRVATAEKVVALTFDDGPNEPYTSQLLDLLERYDIKATFFVVGKNAERYPEVVRRIVAEGHAVGNHSYSHREWDLLAESDVRDEIQRTQGALKEIAGVEPRLFRPPYGQKTPWELRYIQRQGMMTVAWSVSASDPRQPPPEVIARRVVLKTRPGAIILLHDGAETRHGVYRGNTVAALSPIIEELLSQGYDFVTVPELLKVDPYLN